MASAGTIEKATAATDAVKTSFSFIEKSPLIAARISVRPTQKGRRGCPQRPFDQLPGPVYKKGPTRRSC